MSRRAEIPKNYLDPEVATGTVALPISTVKKTIKADEEVFQTNKQASFVVTVATEMFIQYLAEQGVKALASARPARKTLQYKDIASAVSRIDNLEFLSDVIPPVVATTKVREKKTAVSRKKVAADEGDAKQTMLSFGGSSKTAPAGITESGIDEDEEEPSLEEAPPKVNTPEGKGKEVEKGAPSNSQDIDMENS